MQPSRRWHGKRREEGRVEACEGEELRLVVSPLDLHGAQPSGGVLETAASYVLAGEVLGC
jgi:hypothetical protein